MSLKGDDLTLRAVEAEDLDLLKTWRNTPEIRAGVREFRLLSDEHQEQWFDSLHSDRYPSHLMFIIDANPLTEQQKSIGTVGLCYIDWKNKNAEISFYIGDKNYLMAGYCVRALRCLIEYGFDELGLRRIWAESFEGNAGSQAVLKKLGFIEEGRCRSVLWRDGRWHDSIISARLRDDPVPEM